MSPAIEEMKSRRAAIGINAHKVASKRYSLKDQHGNPIEDWPAIVRRVVTHVSAAESDSTRREDFCEQMSRIMLGREFLPNTPCLVNAGRASGQLAACFVLEVPDSIEGIMEHAKTTTKTSRALYQEARSKNARNATAQYAGPAAAISANTVAIRSAFEYQAEASGIGTLEKPNRSMGVSTPAPREFEITDLQFKRLSHANP